MPVELSRTRAATGADASDDATGAGQAKRNFYRFLKRFATRRDLLGAGPSRDS